MTSVAKNKNKTAGEPEGHAAGSAERLYELYRRAAGALLKRKGSTAIGHLQRALRELEGGGENLEQSFYLTMLFSWADLFWSIHRADLVLEVFDLFESQSPGDPHIALQRAIALFHLARFDEARALLSDLEDRGYPAADLYFFLGCLAERVSREATAMSHFTRAAALEPERYSVPGKSDEKTVRSVIKRLIGRAPEPLRASLSGAQVIVEPLPSDKLLSETNPKLDPLALTMVDVDSAQAAKGVPTVRAIRLFVKNIDKVAASNEELEERLTESLTHELSDLLHSDEQSLRDLMAPKH